MASNIKNFREDINGLRAWAVLAVILYHFGIVGFDGGFVGVDIFFVISGFLMTGIIVSGIENKKHNEKFSLSNFYLSRARRIAPALLALCTSLMIAGWLLLSTHEYKSLSTDTLSALAFLSNIQFWRGSGYFDAASHEKLLLHTWSLSVEWQFYLILPVLLIGIWKIRPDRSSLTIIITLCLILSLLLSIIITPIAPTAAFYLLPTRAWEMLAGSLIYLSTNSLKLSSSAQKTLERCGFALIISSLIFFDPNSIWPGWLALVPVIGTMLVLTSARKGSLWTGSRIAQWLGECSYSLYLWHWPFAVSLTYLQIQNNFLAIIISLALTLVFGWLSYRLIETPARISLTRMPNLACIGVLLAATFAVMFTSLLVRVQDGIPGRLPSEIDAVFNEIYNKNPRQKDCHVADNTPVPECTYGGNKLGAIVIGDSHAAAIIRSIEKSLPSRELHVLDWTMSNCPTIEKIKRSDSPDNSCGKFITHAISKSKELPKNAPIIIINRTSLYALGPNEPDRRNEIPTPNIYLTSPHQSRSTAYLHEIRAGFINTACELSKTRTVYMVRPIPELKQDVPKTMGRAMMLGTHSEVSISLEEYHKRNALAWETQDLAAKHCGVKILDPLPYLCRDGLCKGDVGGVPIYFDDDHLSERGGSLLIPMFRLALHSSATSNESLGRSATKEEKQPLVKN